LCVIDTNTRQFSRTLRNAILLPVGVIVLAALIISAVGFEFLRVIDRSDHSREIGRQILFVHETLLQMEGSVLAYELQGDPALLASVQQGKTHIDADFAALRAVVTGNRDLETAADELVQKKDTWLAHAEGSISLRQKGKVPPLEWTRLGGTLRDNLNDQLALLVQKQMALRDQRLLEVTHMEHVFVLSCCLVALLLALAVSQLVRRQFAALALDYRKVLVTARQRNKDLQRSETDLEQQKEWFRVTLTSIGDGVIVTDKDGRIVFMNHEAEKLTGRTAVEALLAPLGDVFRLVHEQTREKMESSVDLAFRRNEVVGPSRFGVLVSPTGEEWPVTDTSAPMRDRDGALLGVVLVFHNATESRQAQKAMRQYSDELEIKVNERTAHLRAAIDQLETFSYTISHDLRAPLRAMRGFAEATLEDYGDRLDEDGRDYLNRITKAAERLDRLIQELLTYTRVVRADAPLVDVDLDKVTREITENYPNLHEPAAEVQIGSRLPHVWGHESALTQVIANLLGNAAKFVPQGTHPRIRIWSEETPEHKMRLWIKDNGIGVEMKDAGRIFTMFERANTDPRYGGTGVGLAIVKKAVEAMHGAVGVEPCPEGGSRFWVELQPVDGAKNV
jgi:PAS domain S-box-containing protein